MARNGNGSSAAVGERVADWPRFLEWLANMRGGRLVLSRFDPGPVHEALPWHAESGYGDDAIAAEGGDVAEALAELARFVTGGGEPLRRPELTPAITHVAASIEELDELIGDDPGACFVNSIEGRARDALRAALDALVSAARKRDAAEAAIEGEADDDLFADIPAPPEQPFVTKARVIYAGEPGWDGK